METKKRYKRMQGKLMEEMKKSFRPEFLNRVDEIIIFHRLNMDHLTRIFDLLIANLIKRVEDKDIGFEISQEAKNYLCKESQISDRPGVGIQVEGSDTISRDGARPLLRVIQRELENTLAEKILSKEFVPGETIKVDMNTEDNGLVFSKGKPFMKKVDDENAAKTENKESQKQPHELSKSSS
jgi:ATP-dependent Clp protease ATP-binding subunit ClpC